MLNYEEFKEIIAQKITDYMPPQFQDCQVEVNSVSKVNHTLDGLHVFPQHVGDMSVTPSIYINDLYERYIDSENLEQVLNYAADRIEQGFEQVPNTSHLLDFDHAKDNIFMQVVNSEQNKELLETLPHREFQDLSIIYRWLVNKDKEGIASIIVTNNLAAQLGMQEEQLHALAEVNTKVLLPPTIRSMQEVIFEILTKDGMPQELAEMMMQETTDDREMYVISNEQGINGAASMLYEEGLHDLAMKLESDLYILPSSLHEVIAVSTTAGDPNELAKMVADINMDQVSIEERLSNQVYHYDKELRTLSLATNTPNKRLDGVVAEPTLAFNSKQQSR